MNQPRDRIGAAPAVDARPSGPGVAVRPGEHACCRFTHAPDAERLVARFIDDGLQRGHRVIWLSDQPWTGDATGSPAAPNGARERALASGQLEIRSAKEVYLPDGRFDVDRTLASVAGALARALRDGYHGLSAIADMSWVSSGAIGSEHVAEYEERLAGVGEDGTLRMLCRYDQTRFGPGALRDVSAAHDVEISPELAPLGRDGDLAGARVLRTGALRLAGELDYDCAGTLADVLAAHFCGNLRLDLADLRYVDVAGVRALRGKAWRALSVAGASEPVRRLLSLMGWDTDPDVEVLEAA